MTPVGDAGGARSPTGRPWFTNAAPARAHGRRGPVSIVGIPERGDSIDDEIGRARRTVDDADAAAARREPQASYHAPRCSARRRHRHARAGRRRDALRPRAPAAVRRAALDVARCATRRPRSSRRTSPAASGSRRTARSGTSTRPARSALALPERDDATDVAVAPDGSAARARACALRASAGARSRSRRPVPARQLALRPGRRGCGWPAVRGSARRAHRAGRRCDDAADARVAPTGASACARRCGRTRGLRHRRARAGSDRRRRLRTAGRASVTSRRLAPVEGARGGSVGHAPARSCAGSRAAAATSRRGEATPSVTDREGNTASVSCACA